METLYKEGLFVTKMLYLSLTRKNRYEKTISFFCLLVYIDVNFYSSKRKNNGH